MRGLGGGRGGGSRGSGQMLPRKLVTVIPVPLLLLISSANSLILRAPFWCFFFFNNFIDAYGSTVNCAYLKHTV